MSRRIARGGQADPDDEDSQQQAFINILRNWENKYEFLDDAKLRSTLGTTMKREKINIFRTHNRIRAADTEYMNRVQADQPEGIEHAIVEEACNVVLKKILSEFLAGLESELQKKIIRLHIMKGIPIPAIAEMLEMDSRAVENQKRQAVRALRKEANLRYKDDPKFAAFIDDRPSRGRHRREETGKEGER